jgi:hypothetical protein
METFLELFCNKQLNQTTNDTSILFFKKIKFNKIIKMIIIPNRDELIEIKKDLWWNTEEIKENTKHISSIFIKLKKINPNMTINDFIEQIEE